MKKAFLAVMMVMVLSACTILTPTPPIVLHNKRPDDISSIAALHFNNQAPGFYQLLVETVDGVSTKGSVDIQFEAGRHKIAYTCTTNYLYPGGGAHITGGILGKGFYTAEFKGGYSYTLGGIKKGPKQCIPRIASKKPLDPESQRIKYGNVQGAPKYNKASQVNNQLDEETKRRIKNKIMADVEAYKMDSCRLQVFEYYRDDNFIRTFFETIPRGSINLAADATGFDRAATQLFGPLQVSIKSSVGGVGIQRSSSYQMFYRTWLAVRGELTPDDMRNFLFILSEPIYCRIAKKTNTPWIKEPSSQKDLKLFVSNVLDASANYVCTASGPGFIGPMSILKDYIMDPEMDGCRSSRVEKMLRGFLIHDSQLALNSIRSFNSQYVEMIDQDINLRLKFERLKQETSVAPKYNTSKKK